MSKRARVWSEHHTVFVNDQFKLHKDDATDGWDPTATAAQIKNYFELLDVTDTAQETPFHKDPPIDFPRFKTNFKSKAGKFIAQGMKDRPENRRTGTAQTEHPPQAPSESITSNNLYAALEGHTEKNQICEAKTVVLPSMFAKYRSRGKSDRRSTSGYAAMLMPSGSSDSCENGSPAVLADDGESLEVKITTRSLFNPGLLYSSANLVKYYGGDHNVKIAFDDEIAANHKSSDGTIIPWAAKILLSQKFAAVGTIPGLKEARRGEAEVSCVV